jgi:hypothetical protein
VATFGFLHTAEVHVAVFTGLLREMAPDDEAIHVVDPSLLADARLRLAVDDDLRTRIGTGLEDLRNRGAGRMVCTCSTIGGDAERVGLARRLDVCRVDRPMAEAAVAHGGRIAVVAALESTMEPTRALLTETAEKRGQPVTIIDAPCLEAWTRWEAGDVAGYLTAVADHLKSWGDRADVIVLAQASMAPAEKLVQLAVPVLSSPRPAVLELVR